MMSILVVRDTHWQALGDYLVLAENNINHPQAQDLTFLVCSTISFTASTTPIFINDSLYRVQHITSDT